MAKIPPVVLQETIPGLEFVSRGKVRDTYHLGADGVLLSVASDRISIFDFVLPATVPQKGEVLTALNIFWAARIDGSCRQDLLAFGMNINDLLSPKLRDKGLPKRAIVVKELQMLPVEAVVRGYLTGSGWGAYKETAPNHMVCGHSLDKGLKDGDRLPEPIFTPTTKAIEGHDEHMNVELARKRFDNRIETASIYLFEMASEIAFERGIIIADTKLEFGTASSGNGIVLGDERFTPDSSRFWLLDDWQRSREEGRSPISFDKQFVREWGKTVGIDKLDPKRPEDVAYVHGLTVPPEVLAKTTQLYRQIFQLITGMELEAFQRSVMGISV